MRQVSIADTRGHHWSTTTTTSRHALLQTSLKHDCQTHSEYRVSVRARSDEQHHCGQSAKSICQTLAAPLEHHNHDLRTRLAAYQSQTCRPDSQCVSGEYAGRIGRATSLRPERQVSLADTRGHHWSMTTLTSEHVLLQTSLGQAG